MSLSFRRPVHFTAALLSLTLIASVLACDLQGPIHKHDNDYVLNTEPDLALNRILNMNYVLYFDTVFSYRPGVYEEQMRILPSHVSLLDYCLYNLRISNPEYLFDGEIHEIVSSHTNKTILIRWNSGTMKLDTIP